MAGAPCTLTTNLSAVATRKGICNGTSGYMHSLCFDSDEEELEVWQVMSGVSQRQFGEVVWLRCIPAAALDALVSSGWPSNDTLVDGS